MMNVILTTKESITNKGGVRTKSIEGEASALPRVGFAFIMIGPGLTGGIRYIKTTTVNDVKEIKPGLVEFSTKNTVYQLEVLKDPVPVEELQ